MSHVGSSQEIDRDVREYLLSEFLLGEDPEALTASTPLISGGILDSIGVTKLVTYLESKYSVRFESEEISVDNLDTVSQIVAALEQKIRDGVA